MTEPAPTPTRMPLAQARFVAVAASAIAFAAAFAWPAFQKVRVLWYYPLERRWALQIAPDGLAMDWYGRTLVSGLAATAVYFAACSLLRVGEMQALLSLRGRLRRA